MNKINTYIFDLYKLHGKGMRYAHVWWNYPPCIQCCNKECLPFNASLVLRGFIHGLSVTTVQH